MVPKLRVLLGLETPHHEFKLSCDISCGVDIEVSLHMRHNVFEGMDLLYDFYDGPYVSLHRFASLHSLGKIPQKLVKGFYASVNLGQVFVLHSQLDVLDRSLGVCNGRQCAANACIGVCRIVGQETFEEA